MKFHPGLILCLLVATVAAHGAEPAVSTNKLNKKIESFTLKDLSGKAVSLADFKDRKALVLVFLSFECPVSNSYAQPLANLARQYADRVAFLGIVTSEEPPATLAKQAREFALPFPLLREERLVAANALKATTAPEAFLLDHNQVLRYRGRIDNGYAARLKRTPKTTREDLRLALDELLAGKPVSVPATPPIGCPLLRDRVVKKTGKVTFHRDVVPILQKHCQECHRPGAVGPFSLLTYRQAVNWAGDLKEYTQARKMPPWKLVEGVPYHNERKMSTAEIDTLARWVDDDTPEGDPRDAPPPRPFGEGWQLGKPDLILECGAMTVGASGRDMFRCFVLPTNFPEDRHVTAVEVRPGNPRVVHHSLILVDKTGKARKLEQEEQQRTKAVDEQDRGPGYSRAMGVGFFPQGALGGWAPGQVPRHLPEGTAFSLPRGADIVVQLHYHRNGRVEKDNTSIGVYFSKKPALRKFEGMVIPGSFLFVPPLVERYRVEGMIQVMQDCDLHSVMPHMHMLGKEIKVTLYPKDGAKKTLLAIKDWDYNWQETYWLKESIHLKAGSCLEVEAVYDNSLKNPLNPFTPPRLVTVGEQTTNEMCFVFLGATSNKPGRIFFLPISKSKGKHADQPRSE